MFFHKDVFLSTAAGPALNLRVTGRAVIAAGVFCLLAGAIYTINDIVDVEADRVHPVKRERPIASGEVPEGLAKAMAAALVIVSLGAAFLLDWRVGLVASILFRGKTSRTTSQAQTSRVSFDAVGLIASGFGACACSLRRVRNGSFT